MLIKRAASWLAVLFAVIGLKYEHEGRKQKGITTGWITIGLTALHIWMEER